MNGHAGGVEVGSRLGSMPTLNLGRGFFDILDERGKTTVWLHNFQTPCVRYGLEFEAYFNQLPAISEAYDVYKKLGCSPGEIIDELLKLYLPLRLFRVGDFENLPLCLGLIGTRGSGKTAGAVQIVCLDYLFRGLPAYSNIEIAIRVAYKDAEKVFQSEPLNKMNMLDLEQGYQNGVVLLDEVNMEGGEGQRASSGANLQLGYAIQQIRKRQLSFIWTCQGWGWVDNRLRWQLDFAVACSDAYLTKGESAAFIGERSKWVCHDLSGITGTFDLDFAFKHKYLSDFNVWKGDTFTRPWWFVYNTYELKGQEDYVAVYREQKALKSSRTYDSLPEGKSSSEDTFVSEMKACGLLKMYSSAIWEAADVVGDKAGQMKLGIALKKGGYRRRRDGSGAYYYELEKGGEDNG